jgi:hypothetical protein
MWLGHASALGRLQSGRSRRFSRPLPFCRLPLRRPPRPIHHRLNHCRRLSSRQGPRRPKSRGRFNREMIIGSLLCPHLGPAVRGQTKSPPARRARTPIRGLSLRRAQPAGLLPYSVVPIIACQAPASIFPHLEDERAPRPHAPAFWSVSQYRAGPRRDPARRSASGWPSRHATRAPPALGTAAMPTVIAASGPDARPAAAARNRRRPS